MLNLFIKIRAKKKKRKLDKPNNQIEITFGKNYKNLADGSIKKARLRS